MRAAEIIQEVIRQGGCIGIDDDHLKLTAPRPLPASLMDEIRSHKPELMAELAPLPYAPCYQCGIDTQAMLTRPDGSWDWQCIPCFDRGARPLPDTQKARSGDCVNPNKLANGGHDAGVVKGESDEK